ncbi:hypothetical protein AG0111_0g9298 [Alternaria gaisen]|uniref:Uncharacterized protein n=1 Tax=Alternaria gaisen TaxID=167740 RepID=A0ACB6FEP8_9PLEO|nr:hypothetical protein AG0111_0g9298 [Alternaria gaisen]
MARTRATQGRPRPPSCNTIARIVPRLESTVEALRASITSIELDNNKADKTPLVLDEGRARGTADLVRDMDEEEEHMINIKQEEDDMVDVVKVAARAKRRIQDPAPKASATKKHKPFPAISTTRTTRSKTLTSRIKPDSIHFDTNTDTYSEAKHDSKACDSTIMNTGSFRKNAEISHINSSLDLLRPYMAFQLSVSGLLGKAYKAAQVSMASVLDVAESLEKQRSIALTKKRNSLSSSAEDGEVCTDRENGAGGEEEEDVLPRKQRELNEQTRKRLQLNKRRKGKMGKDNRDAVIRPSSSFSTSSDAATELASDMEDEAKYPPTKSLSVLSTTSSYQSLHRSTDSAETSS